jgi:hypothetical protein
MHSACRALRPTAARSSGVSPVQHCPSNGAPAARSKPMQALLPPLRSGHESSRFVSLGTHAAHQDARLLCQACSHTLAARRVHTLAHLAAA